MDAGFGQEGSHLSPGAAGNPVHDHCARPAGNELCEVRERLRHQQPWRSYRSRRGAGGDGALGGQTVLTPNPRLVAIPIHRGDVKREDQRDLGYRDQRWAEGLKRLDDGGSFQIPENVAPAAKDSNARLVSALSRYCR